MIKGERGCVGLLPSHWHNKWAYCVRMGCWINQQRCCIVWNATINHRGLMSGRGKGQWCKWWRLLGVEGEFGWKRHLFVIYNGESMETFATARLPQTSFYCSPTFPLRRQAAEKESQQSMFEYNEKRGKKLPGRIDGVRIGILEWSERQLHQVSEQFRCWITQRKTDHVWIFDVLVSNEKQLFKLEKKYSFYLFSRAKREGIVLLQREASKLACKLVFQDTSLVIRMLSVIYFFDSCG